MNVEQFTRSILLLFVILNPFLLTIYLFPLARELDASLFRHVLVRAALISLTVFVAFAWTGDAFFTDVLQVRFGSFLIFGGLIFLVIGLRFVLLGPDAMEQLFGQPQHVSGSIAMPFMIGPGTVSASILAGARLSPWVAALAIFASVSLTVVCVLVLKYLHDAVVTRNARLIHRYADVVGRVSALIIGTVAVEMVANGVYLWVNE